MARNTPTAAAPLPIMAIFNVILCLLFMREDLVTLAASRAILPIRIEPLASIKTGMAPTNNYYHNEIEMDK